MVQFASRPATPPEIRPIEIAFIPLQAPPEPEVRPPAPPPPEPPPPAPVPPKPRVVKPAPPKPAPPRPAEPVLAESPTALSTAEPFPAPEPAPAPPAAPQAAGPSTPAPAAAAPVSAARFDADYLNNPAPAYPPLSRRMREEGKVMLRVVVSPEGLPAQIAIANTSGSTRLDEAARNAVSRWRFVPARRGDTAIEASVLVPIIFKLEGS